MPTVMPDELEALTSAGSEDEAELLGEWLAEAGIRSVVQTSAGGIRLGAAAERTVYVQARDRARALEVLNAEVPSAVELAALGHAPTQLTRPAVGDPIEIPVPRREDIERLLSRLAAPSREDRSDSA
jgi:hypothetical protein